MKILNDITNIKTHLTFNCDYNINNINVKFYSCNFSFVKEEDNYLVNFRCVNYLNITSLKFNGINEFITINVMVRYDKDFNVLDKVILSPNFDLLNKKNAFVGVEDIRLFKYKNDILFTGGVAFDKYRSHNNGIMCGNYLEYAEKKETYVTPYQHRQTIEKNWVYFENGDELYLIYHWSPLTICKLVDNELVKIKEINFKLLNGMRGSSSGIKYNSEIWFITHTSHNRSFEHYFVIFDLDMKLLRVSEPFKFENYTCEYCMCFHIENDRFFIGYSINDNSSILNIYNVNDLLTNVTFQNNE